MSVSPEENLTEAQNELYQWIKNYLTEFQHSQSIRKMMQAMKLVYEDEFQRALQEDGSSSSSYITPKTYYPGT